MMMHRATVRLALTLLVSVLVIGGHFLVPLKADAQVNVVVNGGSGTNAERQLVTLNNQMQGLLQQLVNKEYNLDPAASQAKAQAAVAYYNQQKQFIARGNEGKPYFIDNVELYRAQLRATTTLNAIRELREGKMCDAFKDEVLAQLTKNYIEENARTVAQKNSCELDEASQQNTQAFLNGDFEKGGIQALWAITQNPENTPIGAYLENERLVEEQADEAEENALLRANWSGGFSDQYNRQENVMVCTRTEENGIRDNCRVATPGVLIKERAAALLNIEGILKTSADELGETEHALIEQSIVQTATQGITGQAYNPLPTNPTNPTDPTNPNGQTDPCTNAPNDPKQPATQNCLAHVIQMMNTSQVATSSPVRQTLVRTLTKLQYQLQTVSIIDDAEEKHQEAQSQYSSCYNLAFPNNFSNERTLTLTEIPYSVDAIKKLHTVFEAYDAALKSGGQTAAILAEFQQLVQSTFAIPTEVDLADIAGKFNGALGEQLSNFNLQYNSAVNSCSAS